MTSSRYLVTGGAGFIGSNYVNRLLSRGEDVTIFDNLSRRGAERNLVWLQEKFGNSSINLIQEDVRDANAVKMAAQDKDIIIHLAGQVAVTTSVDDPREDFEINALGTFNVLEGARLSGKSPIVTYSSTNKVYGGMEEVDVREGDTSYYYADYPNGISESQNLDFHSPYGCSKGCGDQYIRDYARIYGLRTIVFRQSCIYGPRQFGIEDQGWVAWFVIAALTGKKITIYGDGKQVRDLLFVEDLLDAYDAGIKNIDNAAGQVFNVGGGPNNTMSVWAEFQGYLEEMLEKEIPVERGDWRPGDQRIYVSDIRKAETILGWRPSHSVPQGLAKLVDWAKQNSNLFIEE